MVEVGPMQKGEGTNQTGPVLWERGSLSRLGPEVGLRFGLAPFLG